VSSLLRKLRYPRRCYAICAVARSGSNLLSDGLHATRRAGRPNQFFCELFEASYAAKYQLDPERDYAGYIHGIIEKTETSNYVFGFKVMGWYVDSLLARLRATGAFGDASDSELLQSAFPRLQLIRIQRRDKLRQAISKARAYQSGQWKMREKEPSPSHAQFDLNLIDRCLLEIRREEEAWTIFFQRTNMQPLELEYEDLAQNYNGTLRAVLAFLKIRAPGEALATPATVKQSDAISDDWEKRYRDLKEPLAAA
jgi:LPS sulfotransferase NodH